MSSGQILFLGAVAGATIFIGLPVGRMQSLNAGVKSFLSATATGILLFLLWDVITAAVEPVEDALTAGNDARFFGLATLLTAGFAAGLLSLAVYDSWLRRRRNRALLGPGAASIAEFEVEQHLVAMSPSRWLAVFIATGIGLHNFSEGLAIGQSAASGELSLALALIIGFGLHNATEGFGIVGPMSGEVERPSWGFLGLLGLIGGGPTFLGTIVGSAWVNEAISIAFFAVAAGSILYVVQELMHVNRKFGLPVLVTWMLLLGLFLGFATDFVLEAAEHAS